MSVSETYKWILVTGASCELEPEEEEIARQIGAMLARNNYALIVGDWNGVDAIVMSAFLELVPAVEQGNRIKHIANSDKKGARITTAEVLADDGDDPNYSISSIYAADAGIIISGREGSKPSMEALIRHSKPVLPIAFLGYDSFEVYRQILGDWNEQPVPGLTELQFMELMKPWRKSSENVSRLLRASLVKDVEIFLSYRRDDLAATAGRIYSELTHAFGKKSIFIDYENLDSGEHLERIIHKVRKSKVLIAMIGKNWNTDRLNEKSDYVRRELETAYNEGLHIIPVLDGYSRLPNKQNLPKSLHFILNLNFISLHMDDWNFGIMKLRKTIKKKLLNQKEVHTSSVK